LISRAKVEVYWLDIYSAEQSEQKTLGCISIDSTVQTPTLQLLPRAAPPTHLISHKYIQKVHGRAIAVQDVRGADPLGYFFKHSKLAKL